MFDDQHNQIGLMNLQVIVLLFNRVQDVTWTKVKWWSDDQHHKQDSRSTREDPRYQAKSKYKDRNQVARKITKKRAHRGDRTLDRTLAESDQTLRSKGSATTTSVATTGRWVLKSTGRRTTASDRVQKGSRAAKLWPDASSVRSIDRSSNGWDDRTRLVRIWSASG